MPAPVSEPLRSTTSRRARAPRAWPRARDAIPRPSWVGCTPITPRVLTRSGFAAPAAAPLCAQIAAALRDAVCAAQRTAAPPPREGADPAPRWTLKRLMLSVRERFGCLCCRETLRAALHRRKLSWKKAKKLLGRADPEQRQAFVEQLQGVLDGAQHDRHLLVYVDEAHIHLDADLGYGWAERGQRFWGASSSPGLSARVSFYGLYLYNEGQVRLWPYPRANGDHTIEVLRRLRAEVPERKLILLWDGAPYHRAQAVREAARTLDIELMPLPGYSPDGRAPRGGVGLPVLGRVRG